MIVEATAQGADTLLTVGAFGSAPCLATSIHSARHGFAVHGVLVPQPLTSHAERNLVAGLGAGATHHPVRHSALAPAELLRVMARLRVAAPAALPHPAWRHFPPGALGYVDAGLELVAQIDAGQTLEPQAIYMALRRSGGTAVGSRWGWPQGPARAHRRRASHAPPSVAPRAMVDGLIERVVHDLHARDPRFPRVAEAAKRLVVITDESRGAGYGQPDDAATRASELALSEDIELDPTYTAKAFAQMLRHAEGERRDSARCSSTR
ncbi:MAG: hypothetical protein IPI43_23365 [Sandaracinaceae bacterium]|nr:hypothetical protein [Sandaracinaceae bacterium]